MRPSVPQRDGDPDQRSCRISHNGELIGRRGFAAVHRLVGRPHPEGCPRVRCAHVERSGGPSSGPYKLDGRDLRGFDPPRQPLVSPADAGVDAVGVVRITVDVAPVIVGPCELRRDHAKIRRGRHVVERRPVHEVQPAAARVRRAHVAAVQHRVPGAPYDFLAVGDDDVGASVEPRKTDVLARACVDHAGKLGEPLLVGSDARVLLPPDPAHGRGSSWVMRGVCPIGCAGAIRCQACQRLRTYSSSSTGSTSTSSGSVRTHSCASSSGFHMPCVRSPSSPLL